MFFYAFCFVFCLPYIFVNISVLIFLSPGGPSMAAQESGLSFGVCPWFSVFKAGAFKFLPWPFPL